MKARTLPGMFFERVALSGPERAVLHKVDGRWVPVSWDALAAAVRETARGLAGHVSVGDRVGILSENRWEWWVADLAVLALGAITVPIYPTSPAKDVAFVLRDCGARVLFVSGGEHLGRLESLQASGEAPPLDLVVTFDEVAEADARRLSLSTLRRRDPGGGDVVAERAGAFSGDDRATFIYTSGTTGQPKGVMLTHQNLLSNVEASQVIVDHIDMPEWLMLSFLPLSHALERTLGYYVPIRFGIPVAFAESLDKLVADMQEVRPGLIISVPRIYEKVYARVLESAQGGLRRRLLEWALEVGRRHVDRRLKGRRIPPGLALQHRLADRLVFEKIRQRMGGRLRYGVSGGAPLAPEIAYFFHALGVTIFEGYGLTETGPVVAANRPDRLKIGSVGPLWPGVDVRIAPEPGREGEGEILIKGPSVMRGYHRNPEADRDVFDAEGWFHSGDIGYLDADGMLHITDRKKDLLKTSGGKYVAPAPIENALKLDPLVEQAVVVGEGRKYCVALLVPDFDALRARVGRELPEGEALDADPAVRALFQPAVERVNRGLGSWEQVKRFRLLGRELTQEAGELTPTLKVKRRVIDRKYAAEIEALYQAVPASPRQVG